MFVIPPIAKQNGSFLARAATERIDIIGIGDSNQFQGGHGWDHGMQQAMVAAGYDMYATALNSNFENNGNGSSLGYDFATFVLSSTDFSSTGAPSAIADLVDMPAPLNYGYRSSATAAGKNNRGLIISELCDIDVNANLEAKVHYATFDTGSGEFAHTVRRNNAPYTVLVNSGTISTNTGTEELAVSTVAISASTKDYPMINMVDGSAGVGVAGPALFAYHQWINTDRAAGFSYHTMHAVGGSSLFDMATEISNVSDDTLSYYLGAMKDNQGGSYPNCLFMINSGVNDRNETSASITNSYTPGDSAAAYLDNLEYIVDRLEGIYTTNSWSLSGIRFAVIVSHPVSDPLDSELESYRTQVDVLAASNPRVQHINLTDTYDEASMLSGGYYASGGADRNHLTQVGYEALSATEVTELEG